MLSDFCFVMRLRHRQRAAEILDAVLKEQYVTPGVRWYGTYKRTPEEPDPTTKSLIWRGYDPNWRVFIGTTFAMILIEFPDRISPELSQRMYKAIDLAIEGEISEKRLLPTYTNIALMYGSRGTLPRLMTSGPTGKSSPPTGRRASTASSRSTARFPSTTRRPTAALIYMGWPYGGTMDRPGVYAPSAARWSPHCGENSPTTINQNCATYRDPTIAHTVWIWSGM